MLLFSANKVVIAVGINHQEGEMELLGQLHGGTEGELHGLGWTALGVRLRTLARGFAIKRYVRQIRDDKNLQTGHRLHGEMRRK